MDLLTEKNKEMYFDYFQITKKDFFKTRLKWIFLVLIVYGVLLYFYPSVLLLSLTPVVLLTAYKLPYYNLMELRKQDNIIRRHMFPKFLYTFSSLVHTEGNVYKTLEASIEYIEEPFQSKLKKLVNDLDENKVGNREVYLKFAEYIDTNEAINIMNTIHSFDEHGIKQSDLEKFEELIRKMQDQEKEESIKRRDLIFFNLFSTPIIVIALFYILSLVYTLLTGIQNSINF